MFTTRRPGCTGTAWLALVVAALPAQDEELAPHDRPFWRAFLQPNVLPPDADQLPLLVHELSAKLGSPDPEQRDDIAYSVLAHWIYRRRAVPPGLRRELLREWTDNLRAGIGEPDTDRVALRSFSALSLGLLVALDDAEPWLETGEFEHLLAAALTYLHDEHDVRGYDAKLGWLHSAAHTADLLKFLARSPRLTVAGQATILAGIGNKLAQTPTVFTQGEDERLARAVLSLVARSDFDAAGFARWLPTLSLRPAEVTPAQLASAQNGRHLLVSLFALLSLDARDLPSLAGARESVLAALKQAM
ncbi:MAG TPA: DUF2785 domain-containing protein [Planctomycetota bacterium]|nr:DUF2785 domain-containing protein [Planctomycetota bacterium]